MRTPLDRAHLSVGRPVGFDVYDKHGRLLLRSGNIVASDAQLERLFDEGLYGDISPEQLPDTETQAKVYVTASPALPPKVRVAVLDMVSAIKKELADILRDRDRRFPAQVLDLAR